jgi:para-nitrobenzyl esterase
VKRIGSVVAMVALLACASSAHKAATTNLQFERSRRLVVVQTIQGQVAGFHDDYGVNTFLGISYAAPPTGALRFAPPQAAENWTYVRPAYQFSPTCPQPLDEIEVSSLLYQDEDCLSLNIWTPGNDDNKRPVVVWIHGGGFVQGGTGDPLYNGAHLAKRGDIVVATINYRVAALGFLALDSFGAEFAGSGNLALQDQIAALTWIKNNISRFGGDPTNITIMGESAGGASVSFLMISPRAKGLFQKVIAQSGTLNLARTKEKAAQFTQRFMELAGAKDVTGLRALSAQRIVDIEGELLKEAGFEADWVFAPVMDDIVIPLDPMKTLATGAAAGIPLMNGTNHDEYRYWTLYFPPLNYIPSEMLLPSIPGVATRLGDRLDPIMDHYRKRLPSPGLSGVTFALITDMAFRIPHIRVSDIQSKYAPVWMYRFDWKSTVSEDLGACHTIELPFLFRTFDSPKRYQEVGANPPMVLSDVVMDAWITFIRSGNPNGPGLADWPAYDTKRRAAMIFNDRSAVQDDPDRETRLLYKGLLGDIGDQ